MRTRQQAFTLIELLTVIVIISVLAVVSFAGLGFLKDIAQKTKCGSNLRVLGIAHTMYMNENNGTFVPFARNTREGKVWYFGLESESAAAEGERLLNQESGPLAPYLEEAGGIEVCGSFNYGSAVWKPKFKGASWGYGYNWRLGGGPSGRNVKHITDLDSPSKIIVFGDCAQANTFQPPASPDNPMLEEFYIINETFRTIHFRHGRKANILFADGHVEAMLMEPGTEDLRLKSERLGRVTPIGSLQYLQNTPELD